MRRQKQSSLNLRHQHVDVTTAAQCRISVFQPTRKPVWRIGAEIETPYGFAIVDGRLGMRHRDLVECAKLTAVEQGIDAVGRYCCIVDPNKLRSAMSQGRSRVCWQQMKDLAEDMRTCKVRDLEIFSRPGFGVVTAGILDSIVYQGVGQVDARAGALGGDRRELWKIAFSEAWTHLFQHDIQISYAGHLLKIIALRHGVSQAVARFMLSHQPGASYNIKETLRIVGAGREETTRHRIRELIADENKLAEMGIMTQGVTFHLDPTCRKSNPGFAITETPVAEDKSRCL